VLEKASRKLDLPVLSVDLSACRNPAEALRHLGTTLHFPSWYGANFDALFDCLTDPDWQAGTGAVVLIIGIDSLRRAAPEGFATLIEVFQAAAEAWRAAGKPCWILLDAPASGITPLPEA